MAVGVTIVTIPKSVVADLDYGIDLSPPFNPQSRPWLASGEYVTSLTVSITTAPDESLVINSYSINENASGITGALLIAWLSGGTLGLLYTVTFQFTTNQGRTDERSITLSIVPR
jgi:hypothetical protein